MVRGAFATLIVVASALALGVATAPARQAAPAIGQPSIDKIIFGGSPSNPGIAITGSDLTYDPALSSAQPEPDPTYRPGGHTGCPANFGGNQGYDYGTRLYFVDKSAKPVWAAGRYRSATGELDCIGLIIEQWTSGEIQYRFGSFFKHEHYKLPAGDYVQLVWNHLTTGVHVKYGPSGVTP